RRPFLLRPRQGGLIAFAGISERWRDQEGAETDTVAIITCAANASVTPLHDRMPVVLDQKQHATWLDCEGTAVDTALALLRPAADDLLEAIEMDPKINDSRRDEPGLQQPLQPRLL
ncbi:MAG: SOS response-associated peptidase family protein, partial [Methyloceanibacter sp.]